MTRNKVLIHLIAIPALASSLSPAQVPTPAPSFTISASNVTMPSSGTVPIPFTLTSVNGFAGMVSVTCRRANRTHGRQGALLRAWRAGPCFQATQRGWRAL